MEKRVFIWHASAIHLDLDPPAHTFNLVDHDLYYYLSIFFAVPNFADRHCQHLFFYFNSFLKRPSSSQSLLVALR